mmetsp:Transcript_43342/g.113924  ORF Transcript_43342/g.113924 Transcript_43342/m.113924 type:complete len:107 (+) Transcript_43342:1389-1709(+)
MPPLSADDMLHLALGLVLAILFAVGACIFCRNGCPMVRRRLPRCCWALRQGHSDRMLDGCNANSCSTTVSPPPLPDRMATLEIVPALHACQQSTSDESSRSEAPLH